MSQVDDLMFEVEYLHRVVDGLKARVEKLAGERPATTKRRAHPLLTRMELRVLTMLAQGYANAEIADRLNLATKTVRLHCHFLYKKLGVPNRTSAALYAWRTGVISVDEAWETVKSMQWRGHP